MKAPTVTIHVGDCLDELRKLPDESVHCCVTSPPYFGLRDYGVAGQIGLESSPAEFVARLVAVFAEVRRVLRSDGTCWVNLGDSYASAWARDRRSSIGNGSPDEKCLRPNRLTGGLKEKDLIGIPWMVAFALRADGWFLRQEIIWAKRNTMPESVTDRCTKAHEQIFLLTKQPRYYFDAEAIKEPAVTDANAPKNRWDRDYEAAPGQTRQKRPSRVRGEFNGKTNAMPGREAFRAVTDFRNKRSVWSVATQPFREAHFATFPPDLIRPCIRAGCPAGGVVLDPFFGSGTTGMVALQEGRSAIGIELNPAYAEIARQRCHVTPGLALDFTAPEVVAA